MPRAQNNIAPAITLAAEYRGTFMSVTYRIARWLLAAVLASFAATSFAAPQKQWSIAATPSTFGTASNVMVTLKVTNQTPNGNSNINSLQITLPTGYTFDTTDHPVPVSTNWVGQLTAANGVITLSNMSPLKPQSSFTITAYLNVNTGAVGCTANAWPGAPQTMAFTGSSFSGDTFLLLSTPSTNVNPNNALAFALLPTGSVAVGTPITGSVQATSCGVAASNVAVTATMGNQNSGGTTGANGQAGFTFSTSGLIAGSYTINAGASGYTSISTSITVCVNGLTFTVQPSNVQTGNAVNATVQATSCSTGSVVQGVSITAQVMDSSGNPVGSAQTPAPVTDVNGNASLSFTAGSPGTYKIGAGATNYSSATSATFKVYAGMLNCGDSFASSFVNPYFIMPDQPGYAAGMRNGYNKDGVSKTCVPVLYTFTNNILTSNQVQLSWDTSSQPNAAFEYTLNWQAQPVGTSGWPSTPQPGIAWLNSDGSSTSNAANSASTPAFIPALACLSNKLPAPYGSLASTAQPADTTITVSGVAANPTVIVPGSNPPTAYLVPTPGAPAVPATPFPVVIANWDTVNSVQSTTTERITAKSIASITPDPSTVNPPMAASYYTGTYTIVYNVTRGTATEGYPGGYPGGANPSHAANTLVVSTPLPIIPNDSTTFPAPYAVQTQAQMCIADHGFQAFGSGSSGQVMYWTTVIDIGDGVVKGSF